MSMAWLCADSITVKAPNARAHARPSAKREGVAWSALLCGMLPSFTIPPAVQTMLCLSTKQIVRNCG